LLEAENKKNKLLTFGGAFSNHIAVAYAGQQNGFETIGIIRGKS
jgi:1-aminocyclopropane-1-carboxylate deaminase